MLYTHGGVLCNCEKEQGRVLWTDVEWIPEDIVKVFKAMWKIA